MKRHEYWVYILLCSDSGYYVGVTSNLSQRMHRHKTGFFPRCYTAKRRPLHLVYTASFQWIHDAIAWEKQIKRWSKAKKIALIEGNQDALKLYAQCQNGTHWKHWSFLDCARNDTMQTIHSLLRSK